jgi:uncharacterized repeat protein (TIGR01451 family)
MRQSTGQMTRFVVLGRLIMSSKTLALSVLLATLPAIAVAQVFSETGPGGPIPDGSPGTPLVSTVTIPAGAAGPILDVWIDFDSLAHTWVGDVWMRLIHPDGVTSMDIMSRPGRGSASTFGFSSDFAAGNVYSFSDSGADLFNVAPPAIIPSGTYRSTSNPNPPATNALPYVYTPTSFVATFGGLSAPGIWTLEVSDWATPDPGSIGSWTLNVEVEGLQAEVDLGITKTSDAVGPVNPEATVVYTLDVFNFGPDDATGVTVVDTLPTEVTYVSDTCGAGPPVGQTWTWVIGNLAASAGASCDITVTVNPGVTGSVSNTATVTGNEDDPAPDNNTGMTAFEVEEGIEPGPEISVLEIPTTSEVGLLLMLLALAGAGVWFARR